MDYDPSTAAVAASFSPINAAPAVPAVSSDSGTATTKKPRKPKAKRACSSCQKAHLTCSDERPCVRCIKRGEDCIEGVKKKARYLLSPEELAAVKREAALKREQQQKEGGTSAPKPKQRKRSHPNNETATGGGGASTSGGNGGAMNPPSTAGSMSSSSDDRPESSSQAEAALVGLSGSVGLYQQPHVPQPRQQPSSLNNPWDAPNQQRPDLVDRSSSYTTHALHQVPQWSDVRDRSFSSVGHRPPRSSFAESSLGDEDDEGGDDDDEEGSKAASSRRGSMHSGVDGQQQQQRSHSQGLPPVFAFSPSGFTSGNTPGNTFGLTPPASGTSAAVTGGASTSTPFAFSPSLYLNSPAFAAAESPAVSTVRPHSSGAGVSLSSSSSSTSQPANGSSVSVNNSNPLPFPSSSSSPLPPSHPAAVAAAAALAAPSSPPWVWEGDTSSSHADPARPFGRQPSADAAASLAVPTGASAVGSSSTKGKERAAAPWSGSEGSGGQIAGIIDQDEAVRRNRQLAALEGQLEGIQTPEGLWAAGSGRTHLPTTGVEGGSGGRGGGRAMGDVAQRDQDAARNGGSGAGGRGKATMLTEAVLPPALKPYPYGESHRRLINFVMEKFGEEDAFRVIHSLAEFRPRMLTMTANHSAVDELFIEQAFQRSLSDLTQTLFPLTGTPTAIWRRTGELVAVGPEFCILTEWTEAELLFEATPHPDSSSGANDHGSKGSVLSWRGKHVWEVLEKTSYVEYLDRYVTLAFESVTPAFSLLSTLVTPQGRAVSCCACFSIRRDMFDLPSLVIGQFLPLL